MIGECFIGDVRDGLRAFIAAGIRAQTCVTSPPYWGLRDYGMAGAWVGVGSVCKRNGNPAAIEAVLVAIKRERPDLRLHGFGLKATALTSSVVWELLETADSMAWSYAARMQGRNGSDWREADAYAARIMARPRQLELVGAA